MNAAEMEKEYFIPLANNIIKTKKQIKRRMKMFEILSEGEKLVLNLIKESYDREQSKTIGFIEPKFDIKVKENAMESLQEKGYWEVNRTDMGNRMEMISVSLKDKFFAYFNISLEQ